MRTQRLSDDDVRYIRWLGDNGWFSIHASRNKEYVASNLGVSVTTVKDIACRHRRKEVPEDRENELIVKHNYKMFAQLTKYITEAQQEAVKVLDVSITFDRTKATVSRITR